jgi:CRISPR-associated protein Cmr2
MSFEYIDPLLQKLISDKEGARREYQSRPPTGRTACEPPTPALLRDWLALTITFRLQTSWFSKDDLPFHVLDNPVHRDRAFGAPFMPASSWKGLLRWAARMRSGLLAYLESNGNQLQGWKDSAEIIHLFGNERDEDSHFQRGALAFRPTWFDNVGCEVINPHDRAKKAGRNPILYEVVPPGATGELRLLYAPSPGSAASDGVKRVDTLLLLLDALEVLVTEYGFSAKRTSGWGIATITKASLRTRESSHGGTIADLRGVVRTLLGGAA